MVGYPLVCWLVQIQKLIAALYIPSIPLLFYVATTNKSEAGEQRSPDISWTGRGE